MIFMCEYQIDNDKKTDTQAFFASMTPEQIAGELPSGVKQIGRWHDIPNGCGWAVIMIQFFWQFPHFWAVDGL